MELIKLDGSELLKKAQESAENRRNERAIRKVRDLMIAKEGFTGAVKEIEAILDGISKNDALAYEKLERMTQFVQRVKSVVFDRNVNAAFIKYPVDDEDIEW